jgi:hypothetical protein
MTGHSFYSANILEYPINITEEGYIKNKKLMDETNSKYIKIL